MEKEAVDIFASEPGEYDVILMDLMMECYGRQESKLPDDVIEDAKTFRSFCTYTNAFADDEEKKFISRYGCTYIEAH